MSEFGEAATARSGVADWARIHERNSERDAHKVIAKHGLRLALPLETMPISRPLPWIDPKSWLRFLLDQNLWCRLSGLEPERSHLSGPTWLEFWRRYRVLHPSFPLFQFPGIDLSTTAALYIHGDEGRTLKRSAFMVTSLQSAIGFGTEPQVQHGLAETS